MKTFATKILSVLTRLALWKFKPVIIGITGSVGKTSTKEAITTVLQDRFIVRASSGNYNNEFGLPFTVLNQDSPGKNPFAWAWLIITSLWMLKGGRYPQVLILEMGSDKPGDIAYLLELTGPLDFAVVTDIGVSHMMNYPNLEALAKEKLTLAKGIKKTGLAVLNYDNNSIAQYVKSKQPNAITYGLDQEADVAASELQIYDKDGVYGMNFKIKYGGTVMPILLPNSLGRSNVYAALAAASIGLSNGMNLVEISQALEKYKAPAGRLRMLEGIKHTKIIDDTYNAAPASTSLALEVLTQVAKGRTVAALGGMAELGNQNEKGHRDVATKIQELGIKTVFLVGENAKIILDELEKRHFSGTVKWFADSDAARIPVQNEIREGDTILIKGSQSARMEKIVKEIMAEPELAEKILVRQSNYWLTH